MLSKEERKKKRENFWYYYKWHVIISALIIILIGYTVYEKVTTVHPDFYIDCIADKGISYDSADMLGDVLEQSGAVNDINEDGNITVQVSYCPAGRDNSSATADGSMQQIVQLRMAVGESSIIITEPSIIKVYEQHGIFEDITALADKMNIPEENRYLSSDGKVIGININGRRIFDELGIPSSDLYLTKRTLPADYSKKELKVKEFNNAEAVAEYILR